MLNMMLHYVLEILFSINKYFLIDIKYLIF